MQSLCAEVPEEGHSAASRQADRAQGSQAAGEAVGVSLSYKRRIESKTHFWLCAGSGFLHDFLDRVLVDGKVLFAGFSFNFTL